MWALTSTSRILETLAERLCFHIGKKFLHPSLKSTELLRREGLATRGEERLRGGASVDVLVEQVSRCLSAAKIEGNEEKRQLTRRAFARIRHSG